MERSCKMVSRSRSRSKKYRARKKEKLRQEKLQQAKVQDGVNRKGYLFSMEIEVAIITMCRTSTEHWPAKHPLSQGRDLNESVGLVLGEMASIDVGTTFTVDWCELKILRTLLTKLIRRHCEAPYKYIAWHYASKGRPHHNLRSHDGGFNLISEEYTLWYNQVRSCLEATMPCEPLNAPGISGGRDVLATESSNTSTYINENDDSTILSFLENANNLGTKCSETKSSINNFYYSSHREVLLRFLTACVKHTVPDGLLGCRRNQKIFINRWLPMLTGVPGRKSIGLGRLMKGVKVSKVPWASEVHTVGGRGKAAHVLVKAWLWLLSNYLATVLTCHFVLVETSGGGVHGHQQAFYAKRIWKSMRSHTLRLHMETSMLGAGQATCKSKNRGWMLSPAAPDELVDLEQRKRSPLPTHLQLRVKKNGMRPVLRVRFLPKDAMVKKACLALLKYLTSYSGNNDPIGKLAKAWRRIHIVRRCWMSYAARKQDMKGKPNVYVVKVDIEDAFGSVIHSKLCDILAEKLNSRGLNNNTVITLRVWKWFKHLRNGKLAYRERCDLKDLPAKTQPGKAIGPEWSSRISHSEDFQVGDLLNFLKRCITKQYIKDNKRMFRLSRGLAQGSSFSPYLWDIYLQSLIEKNINQHLAAASGKFSLLVCGMDDILFLTHKHSEAEWFLVKMVQGFDDFNVHIKLSKVVTNFKCTNSVSELLNEQVFGVDYVTFWGFTLDPVNCRITANYGGPPGQNLINKLNLRILEKPWRILESRSGYGNLKLCPLTLSIEYNGRRVVLCNIFRAASVLAGRFQAVTKVILQAVALKSKPTKRQSNLQRKKVPDENNAFNPQGSSGEITVPCTFKCHKSSTHNGKLKCAVKRVKHNQVLLTERILKRTMFLVNTITNIGRINCLRVMPSREEILWLAYKAFLGILGRDGGHYPKVIAELKWHHKMVSKKLSQETMTELQSVVNLCRRVDY